MIGDYESESERDECVGPIGHHNQREGGGDVEHSESMRNCRTWRLNINMTKSKNVGSISCEPQTMMNQRDQESEETEPERARV